MSANVTIVQRLRSQMGNEFVAFRQKPLDCIAYLKVCSILILYLG